MPDQPRLWLYVWRNPYPVKHGESALAVVANNAIQAKDLALAHPDPDFPKSKLTDLRDADEVLPIPGAVAWFEWEE